MFNFTVGVMRWWWRVSFYALYPLGTDRYPPFSLASDDDYPADLSVQYPERLSRVKVIFKWWLLAIPHYIIMMLFVGMQALLENAIQTLLLGIDVLRFGDSANEEVAKHGIALITIGASSLPFAAIAAVGLMGALVLIAAVTLLFRGRYPTDIFDLVMGMQRWSYRVAGYSGLLYDDYPHPSASSRNRLIRSHRIDSLHPQGLSCTPMLFAITPTAPYDFDLTVGSMTYFQTRHAADMFEDGVLRRVLSLSGKPALVSVRSVGSVDAPKLAVEVIGEDLTSADTEEVLRLVRRMLATDADIAAFYAMALDDPRLVPLVRNMYGLRPTCAPTAYEALVLAILGQQISTHVARMLRNLIIETYGDRVTIGGEMLHSFPRPHTIAEAGVEGLRAIKFSRRKAEYITGISQQIVSGELSLEAMRDMPDDEIVSNLMALRGVGAWTAHWMLMRAFGRPDGFPQGDLALQRMMGILVGDGAPMPPDEALAYSERWSPWRSWVTTYMFGAGRTGRFAEIVAGK